LNQETIWQYLAVFFFFNFFVTNLKEHQLRMPITDYQSVLTTGRYIFLR